MRARLLLITSFLLAYSANAQQQRVVLLEQFSNSGCPPCAVSTPPVLNHVEANPATTIAITYHTSFPYRDSMYFENPVDANARTSYYSVGGVPFSILDGGYYRGGTGSLVNQVATQFGNRQPAAPGYTIEILNATLVNGIFAAQVRFTSLSAANATAPQTAHLVVIEQTVLKSSYLASPGANSETEYKYVMRKMLPTAAGTALVNRGVGGSDIVDVQWPIRSIKSLAQVRLVAFVQNETNKNVGQAEMMTPAQTITSVAASQAPKLLTLYPNPATGSIVIGAQANLAAGTPIQIRSALGQIVWAGTYLPGAHISISGLANGVYAFEANTAAGGAVARLLVQH
jgi:hypothetical protein